MRNGTEESQTFDHITPDPYLAPAVRAPDSRERQNVVHRNDLFLKNGGSLTTNQLRLFLYVVAQLPRMLDMEMPAVSIPIETLRQLLNLTGDVNGQGNRLRQILKDLSMAPAAVVDQNGGTILTTWFDFIRISQDGSNYVFQLQPLLQPFFMQLNSQFTVYELGYVLSMRSAHSVRLYDTLKTGAFKGTMTISIEDLKQYMGLVDYDTHGAVIGYRLPEFKQFNRLAIKPAIDEINEKTDLMATYEVMKDPVDRRKVVGIRFTIETKADFPNPILNVPPSRYGKAELVFIDKAELAKGLKGFASDNTIAVFRSIQNTGQDPDALPPSGTEVPWQDL